jgi:hypothetical protein
MSIIIFMDCGAPTLFNQLSKKYKTVKAMGSHLKNVHKSDFSYVNTADYKKYRREYLRFVQEHEDFIDIFSNLDVIHNGELTYKNQKWFERRGVKPLPVWHITVDPSWLHKYLDEGYEYICIGGMTPNPSSVVKPILDRIWTRHLVDEKGMPLVKVHGFAMTSFSLMYRYPWYSVDSKSWIDMARYGKILVPTQKGGVRDWLHPEVVNISDRRLHKASADTHLRTMVPSKQRHIHRYLQEMNIPLGKSSFKTEKEGYALRENEAWMDGKPKEGSTGRVEVIRKRGVRNDLLIRMNANMILYRMIEETVPKWPWALKLKPQNCLGLG